jgi:cobalt/nickel transport system permease protein
MFTRRRLLLIVLCILVSLAAPQPAHAMHIMEGFLPPFWSFFWAVITIPFVARGLFSVRKAVSENPRLKILLAVAGAFAFVLSALKIPSVTGSCSHPTGIGLGAILFGPTAMSIIGLLVLLFQAVLLAHGGLTTLGANTFSMAVAGPFVAYGVFKIAKKFNGPTTLAVFLAALLGDVVTYVTTAVQLSLAFPADIGGVGVSLIKFLSIFAVTQIPLAVSEGILTVLIFKAIAAYNKHELTELKILSEEA